MYLAPTIDVGQLGEPGRAVAALVPEDGEERLVEREVAAPAVARVHEVDLLVVEPHVGGDHVRDERHPRDGCIRVRRRPVPAEPVMERSAAGLDDDRDDVELGSAG